MRFGFTSKSREDPSFALRTRRFTTLRAVVVASDVPFLCRLDPLERSRTTASFPACSIAVEVRHHDFTQFVRQRLASP